MKKGPVAPTINSQTAPRPHPWQAARRRANKTHARTRTWYDMRPRRHLYIYGTCTHIKTPSIPVHAPACLLDRIACRGVVLRRRGMMRIASTNEPTYVGLQNAVRIQRKSRREPRNRALASSFSAGRFKKVATKPQTVGGGRVGSTRRRIFYRLSQWRRVPTAPNKERWLILPLCPRRGRNSSTFPSACFIRSNAQNFYVFKPLAVSAAEVHYSTWLIVFSRVLALAVGRCLLLVWALGRSHPVAGAAHLVGCGRGQAGDTGPTAQAGQRQTA